MPPAQLEDWNRSWDTNARFRITMRVMTAAFGSAFLIDAASRVVMAYAMPLDLVPILSTLLLDLLAQGQRSVEDLAAAADLAVGTCSAHLQTLREAGMVSARRDGKRVFYSLAGDDVAALWALLRTVAQAHRPHTEVARRAYLGPDDTTAVTTQELLSRLGDGHTVASTSAPPPSTTPDTSPGR